MGRDDYSDWDAAFVAPLSATVPVEMGGLRLDQALARLFHQYSRNRLQEWLRAGHITVDGRAAPARMPVTGGEKISVAPPRPPDAAPRAQRMPLRIMHEDAALRGKGRLQPGCDADIVVFDPDTITDRASYQHGTRTSAGSACLPAPTITG